MIQTKDEYHKIAVKIAIEIAIIVLETRKYLEYKFFQLD